MNDSEKNFALRQGHETVVEDAYFETRPQISSLDGPQSVMQMPPPYDCALTPAMTRQAQRRSLSIKMLCR